MAEQGLVYNIKVNASDATKKIQQLRKDIETTSKTMSNLATHSRGYLDTVSKSVASLKEMVSKFNLDAAMKQQLDAGFKDLETKLRSAKSLAKKTSTAVDAFNKDTVDSISRSWKGLEDDLKKVAKKSSEEVQKATEETEKSVVSSISNIQGALATIGITKLTKDILEAASAAERALFALNKIYKSNAAEAQATAESLADIYALSEAGAARQLADASKILDNYNLADDVLLNMSSNMVALSQDLSAFTGGTVDASRAMQALEAALNADYRGLKRTFGIFINNDAMEAIAKRWGLQADSLNDAQKVLLRYQAIMEATTNVTGTFQESQNSLYVTEQELKAAWVDLQVVLGEKLLPLATAFLKFAVGAIEFLSDTGVGTLITFTASVVALVSILNKLILVGGKLITVIRSITVAMLENPILAAIAACAALAIAIGTVVKKAVEAQKVSSTSDDVIKSIEEYTTAEKERAKAIDGTTKAVLALEAAQNREDAINSANKLVKQLKKQTRAEDTAKSNLSTAQNMLAYDEKKIAEVISYWENEQGLSHEEAADKALGSPAWEKYKVHLQDVKESTKDLDEASSNLKGTLKSLAESYYTMSQSNTTSAFTEAMTEIREALTPEQVTVFDEMLANLAKGLPAVVEETEEEVDLIKQLAKELNFVEKDWDKMLEKSSTQLENSREALKKQSDEYRKIRDDAVSALNDEYTESVWAIDDQIEALNKRKADSPNPEAIDEEIARLEESKKQAEQWYRENYEYYNNVYAKNIQTAAEQLETKLTALVYKREQTLKEQEAQTVSDLKTKWEDYAKTFNASIGGGTNIGSVGTSRSSLDAYIESIRGMEGVTEETITKLTLAWETYYGSLGDIEDYYADLRAKKEKELDDELSSLKLASDRLTLKAQQDMEMEQLERQHDAELAELEKEYGDAENYDTLRQKLVAKQLQERENKEDEHQKKLMEIEKAQRKAVATAEQALLYDKEQIYQANKKVLEDELAEELKLADKNGKDKLLIQQEYNAKLEKLERDHLTEMARISNQYSKELLNAQVSNNAARGGWFDLVANAMDRRDMSRSKFANGLTDYLGKVSGIDTQKYEENYSQYADTFKKMIDEGLSEDEMKKKLREMLDDLGYAGEDFELIWGNVWEKMKSNTQSELDSLEDIVSTSLDKMADIFSKIDSLYSMAEQNRMQNLQNMLTDLQNQQDKLEKEASDSGRKLTKNEKDELQRRQDLYEEQIERQEALIKQEQERQFERQKQFAIAEATIQGLQAAVKSFSDNGGWPWGLVAAGLSATFTAAQIAMIKAQPMPSYAQGAYELPEDQTAQVHKGEMIVPKPFAEELRDKGGLGGEITVNVYGASEDATVENTVGSDGMQQLDIFVSGKVKGMVMRGELDAVLQSRYTLQRNGKRG